MRLEHYPQDTLTMQLLDIVGEHVDLATHRVFYFGSRVCGTGDERSDIDVGILGPEPLPLHVLARIREAVEELPTLYTIDIVDVGAADDRFQGVALRCTEDLTLSGATPVHG